MVSTDVLANPPVCCTGYSRHEVGDMKTPIDHCSERKLRFEVCGSIPEYKC